MRQGPFRLGTTWVGIPLLARGRTATYGDPTSAMTAATSIHPAAATSQISTSTPAMELARLHPLPRLLTSLSYAATSVPRTGLISACRHDGAIGRAGCASC